MVYRSWKCSIWVQFQKQQNVLSSFPRQIIQHDSNPSLCPNLWCWRSRNWMVLWRSTRLSRTNTKKKKKKKDVLLFIGDWNAKVVTTTTWSDGKVWLGVQNEAGQRLTDFCQENTPIIANTLVQQHKRQLYTCTPPDSQHRNQTDYILCSQRWKALHSQQKQDLELTLAPFTSPYCKIQT